MKVCKGETYERVFVNEEVNLNIEQEADSHVKIHVINAPFSITVNQIGKVAPRRYMAWNTCAEKTT